MSQWSLRERLQPSLLDRLTDEHPDRLKESSSTQNLDQSDLKAAIIRDLAYLLNCVALDVVYDLDPYPRVRDSVVNFGVADLSGQTASNVVAQDMEKDLMRAIRKFEPRILRSGLKIKVNYDGDKMSGNTLVFDIQGTFFGQPAPFQVSLRSELDLQSGDITVREN